MQHLKKLNHCAMSFKQRFESVRLGECRKGSVNILPVKFQLDLGLKTYRQRSILPLLKMCDFSGILRKQSFLKSLMLQNISYMFEQSNQCYMIEPSSQVTAKGFAAIKL
jgi:hypothetical protein